MDSKNLLSYHAPLFAQNASTLTQPPPGVTAIRPPPPGTTASSKQMGIPPPMYYTEKTTDNKDVKARSLSSESLATTIVGSEAGLEKKEGREEREQGRESGISRFVEKTRRRFGGRGKE